MELGARPRVMTLAAIGLAAALPLTLAVAADAPTGGDKRVRAYVFRNIHIASSGEAGSCPVLNEDPLQVYASSLPPGEREQYSTPDKRLALSRLMHQRLGFRRIRNGVDFATKQPMKGPPGFDPSDPITPDRALELGAYNGFPKGRGRVSWRGSELVYDSCSNPEDFPALGAHHVSYAGKVAPGIDLDGKVGRESFTGLDGTPGVDNQLWRAVGCIKSFRDDANPKVADETMLSASAPTAVVLRDLDDPRNDLDVTVEFYAVNEPIARNGLGRALLGNTYTVKGDPRFRATVRGRIVDGILTTEPVDLFLQFQEQILELPLAFRSARFQMTFKPDGTVAASVNGYQTLASFWNYMEQRTQASSEVSGYTCPGVRQAIDRYADGFRDARTRRYTAISASYNLLGVRAFVVDPAKSAQREASR